MRRRLRRTPFAMRGGFVALLLLLPFVLGVERPPGLGDVREIRTWSYANYTRVVLELSQDVKIDPASLVRLAANSEAHRPERLYVDVPGIWVGRRFEEGIAVGDGLLSAVRVGQNTLAQSRLVIDLQRYERHRLFTLASPPRIVVDVYGDRSTGPRESNGRLPAELRQVNTIVVDPGHGGRDPGATGVGGVREKDINLAIAKKVVKELEARQFEVFLTREGDETKSLEERTALAESKGGDVFISIHANAAQRRSARGIEIYTLDANHERHSLDVAARENGVAARELDPLQRALAEIKAGVVAGHSKKLAHWVHEKVIEGARAADSRLPDLGLKTGPFYVLFMSSMSAVLIETGFITNRADARLLQSEPYQARLAREISRGVDRYRQEIEAGLNPPMAAEDLSAHTESRAE